ncbi:DEAD/DEAH box helicase [Algivirga pacifica]|uniref:Helicase SNF2 n=1 Tax=Algivirga pacifica TaxID=1162670 RepID=A0ABP9DKD5_9BACT
MKVSTRKPFQIVYSLYEHQYLGYLFESFVVQLDGKNKLTLQHQNISIQNAREFENALDERDYKLIRLMDEIQQGAIMKKFAVKKMSVNKFFHEIYEKGEGNKLLQESIQAYLEERRAKILDLLPGKLVFEMGNDGEPTAKTLRLQPTAAEVRFVFHRNEENTHYFPHIFFEGERIEKLHHHDAYLLCNTPAWVVLDDKIIHFKGGIEGNKIKPFLKKKFIAIPKKMEESYFQKFVIPLAETTDVKMRGYGMVMEAKRTEKITPLLSFHTIEQVNNMGEDNSEVIFELHFLYDDTMVSNGNGEKEWYVSLEKNGDEYLFSKTKRHQALEKKVLSLLEDQGLDLNHTPTMCMSKANAFNWLSEHKDFLDQENILVKQESDEEKRYFVGKSSINIEISENKDWFDIKAKVLFGAFEIPFMDIRKLIIQGKHEFLLPSGEVAVIPTVWFSKYADLFHFMEGGTEQHLKKHHLSVVHELKESDLAKVSFDRKLEQLRDFETIEDFEEPTGFQGTLRPYQKAGYNWMNFLKEYNFGGCLADDMGLGKTVQTLALLQQEQELDTPQTSLLVMPTSLLYNWEMEAKKFTPSLKVLNYTGTNRNKNPELFSQYDLVITSYGIVRLDVDILKEYFFNYIVLDESQTIKNPNSNIAKAVKQLKSRRRLILTGTPIENTTMDLWSQMSFVNPGLLGNQTFFKKEFLQPIERKKDEEKYKKLHSIIKPFILRRHKSQVATELPGKVEKVQYCTMTEQQSKLYEETKSSYRNEILDQIEEQGVSGTQMMLLKGLTELRQLANHPKMMNEKYEGDSGKMEAVRRTLENTLQGDHKVLIFSQFVKHLQIIKRYLDEEGIQYSYLDGGTKDRQAEVNAFQEDPQRQVFLISLKAGGLGLNLTAADYVFILDPWWNPAIEAQAVDRAHRIGQENKVFIYKFIAKDTVEEKILALQQSKRELADSLISTEESFMKRLNKEDIEALLS